MTGLFTRLAERALGLTPLLAPRLPTRYEAGWGELEEDMAPTAAIPSAATGGTPRRPPAPLPMPATAPASAAAATLDGRRSSREPALAQEGGSLDLPPAAAQVDDGHPPVGAGRGSVRAEPPAPSRSQALPDTPGDTPGVPWPAAAAAAAVTPAGGGAFAGPVAAARAQPRVARSVAAAEAAPASAPGGSAVPGAAAAAGFPETPAPSPALAVGPDARRPDAGMQEAGRDAAQPHRPAPVTGAQDRSLPTAVSAVPPAAAGPVEITIGRVEIRFAAPAAPRPAAPGAVLGPPSLEALLARDRR